MERLSVNMGNHLLNSEFKKIREAEREELIMQPTKYEKFQLGFKPIFQSNQNSPNKKGGKFFAKARKAAGASRQSIPHHRESESDHSHPNSDDPKEVKNTWLLVKEAIGFLKNQFDNDDAMGIDISKIPVGPIINLEIISQKRIKEIQETNLTPRSLANKKLPKPILTNIFSDIISKADQEKMKLRQESRGSTSTLPHHSQVNIESPDPIEETVTEEIDQTVTTIKQVTTETNEELKQTKSDSSFTASMISDSDHYRSFSSSDCEEEESEEDDDIDKGSVESESEWRDSDDISIAAYDDERLKIGKNKITLFHIKRAPDAEDLSK